MVTVFLVATGGGLCVPAASVTVAAMAFRKGFCQEKKLNRGDLI